MKPISPKKAIFSLNYMLRGHRVMMDRDLAELYGVATGTLNQAVKRNIRRFPSDFMFQLTQDEMDNWVSQIVISIMRAFVQMRQIILVHQELAKRVNHHEKKIEGLTDDVEEIFGFIHPLMDGPMKKIETIGFK